MRLFSILFLFCSLSSFGQSVSIEPTITPEFFAADEQITITYDVTGTSLSSLSDAYLWLWLPDQSNVNIASNVNPASSNTSATNPAKFTKSVVAGKTLFTISLTLTSFTGVAKENILELGMLLKGNDWSDGQSTDFLTSVSTGYSLRLESPASNYGFYSAGQSVQMTVKTSELSTIEFYVDHVLNTTVTSVDLFETTHAVISDGLVHQLKVVGTNGIETEEEIYTYTITPTPDQLPVPDGMVDGINYNANNTTATLVLVAPNHDNVFVVGDFNSWSLDNDYLMHQDGDRFWLTINDLTSGEEYIFQYLVDGVISIADPYSEKLSSAFDDPEIISDNRYPGLKSYPSGGSGEEASYLQPGKSEYNWVNTNFKKPEKEKLVIYELLIRDFTEERTYKAVTDKLDYLQSLGINAIELLPVMEFEGNLSWGYNPSFMTTPDKYYGTEDDLKNLIDEAHGRGIAIILDIALNHAFGRSALVRLDNDDEYGPPTANNVWLNRSAKHDFNVGYDFNHESQYTKNYVDHVVKYWLEEYHVDGYRFDLSKGFTQKSTIGNVDAWGKYDASRVALLKRMADVIWTDNPDAYIILEHFAENTEEQELANYGMMLWGNMNGTYRNAVKANSASLTNLFHTSKGWDSPHLIGYMESHDEERVAWDALKSFDLKQSMQRLKLNAAFFLTVPGPKMIWQFGEMGYDEELNNDRLGIKPTHWEYLEDEERKKLFDVYASLIKLKTKTDWINAEYFSWSASSALKNIVISHPDVSICIVGNFDKTTVQTGSFLNGNGTWYDYFSGESIVVTDYENYTIGLLGGDFKIFTSQPLDNYVDSNPADYVTAIENKILNKISVYPNPARDFINIKDFQNTKLVNILDLGGRQIVSIKEPEERIDVRALLPGLYFVELKDDTGVNRIIRFIKE